ncbi:MAG: Wzz/FepE/Etk N-terminal domain-containing protein, partial [Devosiaceae bacterium]|nr:Wzz/FepE/Etk N-terminal domain-containing protein [Devosiaceae bacterium]
MPTLQNTGNPADSAQYGANTMRARDVADNQALIAIGPLFHTLWQRKGLIALITAIFVGLAFLYVTITPKTYTANGVIV